MKHRSLWILLLCLCLFLTGCQEDEPIQTTVPPTTTPPETTIPAPDPVEVYQAAIEALGKDAIKMTVLLSKTVTVSDQEFTTETDLYMDYLNVGTTDFWARVKNTTKIGSYMYDIEEFYGNGTVYQTIDNQKFTSFLKADEFTLRYPTIQLLDPALYQLELSEDEKTIRFLDATGVEQWLAGTTGQVISADATLELNDSGAADTFQYNVEYKDGSAQFNVSCKVMYSESTRQPTLPESVAEYVTLENIESVWLLKAVEGFLSDASQFTTVNTTTIQCQAGGFAVNSQYSVDSYVTDKGIDYRFKTDIYALDSTGEFQTDTLETYIDGIYTAITDGGEPETYSTLPSVIRYNAKTMLTECMPKLSIIKGATVTNLGSLILIEYDCKDIFGQALLGAICETYFGSPTLLDDYAQSSYNKTMELYIALDSYTLLPTAIGYLYEVVHIIDGYEYITITQMDQSFDLVSTSSYYAIYEEPSPDVEPENKATPLFYHVTGNDGQEMWLFGTIHMGDDRTAYLPREITDALLSSSALALECDTGAFEEQIKEDEKLQEKISTYYYYTDSSTIIDHLTTPSLYEDARKVLRATGNYTYNSNYQKPAVWSNAIDNYYLDQGRHLVSEKGVESRLEKIAEENGIPLLEIESSLFQIEMLMGYSDALQEFQLYSSVYSHGKDAWDSTAELYELWCAGDEAALIEQMVRKSWSYTEETLAEMESQEGLTEEDWLDIQYIRDNLDTINKELETIYDEYITAMEIDRNDGMLEAAIEYLESGETVFYAVGLAHLLAEDGLVNTLRDAGYTVELVPYN